MASSLQTLKLRFDGGGFSNAPNLDSVPPNFMVGDSRNINLDEGGRRTRGGTQKVNSTAVTGNYQFLGLFDFTQTDGTQFIMFANTNGDVHKNTTTTIRTGASTTNYYSFAVVDDTLFYCDGASNIHQWNGVAGTSTAITNPNPNWTTNKYPQQLEIHGRGLSRRLWTWTQDNYLYGSKLLSSSADAQDFSATKGVEFLIPTQAGEAVTAIKDFGDTLFIFTDRQIYLLNDTDLDTANWGIETAQIKGGVANWRLVCQTPNDLVAMMEDGEIYSVRGVQAKGDYVSASLAKPPFISRWIRNNTDLTQVDKFHCVYDPNIRAINFYMVMSGDTRITRCLSYFIDRQVLEAWGAPKYNDIQSIYHGTVTGTFQAGETITGGTSGFTAVVDAIETTDEFLQVSTVVGTPQAAETITGGTSGATATTDASLFYEDTPSGYTASVSAFIKVGVGDFEVYTGDYNGYIWTSEQSARNDDGFRYGKGVELPEISFQDERGNKFVDTITLVGSPTVGDDFTLRYRVDGLLQAPQTAGLVTASSKVGQIIVGIFTVGETNTLSVSEGVVSVGTTCKRFQPYIYDETVNDDFFLSEVLIDFKPLAKQPPQIY